MQKTFWRKAFPHFNPSLSNTQMCVYLPSIASPFLPPSAPPPSLHLTHLTCHITFLRRSQEKGRGLPHWSRPLTRAAQGQVETHERARIKDGDGMVQTASFNFSGSVVSNKLRFCKTHLVCLSLQALNQHCCICENMHACCVSDIRGLCDLRTSWAMMTPIGGCERLPWPFCREDMRWINSDIESIYHPLTVHLLKKIDISS